MDYEIVADTRGVEKFSFSKLNSFHQCKYAYDLCYHKKVKGEGNGFGHIGTEVHSILERFSNEELLQFELVDTFLEEFEYAVPNGVKLYFASGAYKDLTENYKTQCVNFLTNWCGFNGMHVIASEEEFNMLFRIKDKYIFLNGFIDVVAEDKDGEIYIIDYKSKSAFKNKKEVAEYARQLYLYSVWVKHKYGKAPKELWFYQFRIDHIEKIAYSLEELEDVLNWTYNTLVDIEEEQFWLPINFSKETDKSIDNATFFCRNLCDYRGTCDYWKGR